MTPPKIVPCELVSRGSIVMRIAGSEFIKVRFRTASGSDRIKNQDRISIPSLTRAGSDTSRNKRIPRRVAKDPEEDHRRQPAPKINRRNKDAPVRTSRNGALRVPQKSINDERQCQNHQWVQLERGDWMQVQELIKRACRSASGALQSRQQTKRTFGKKLVRGARGIEKEKKHSDRRQTEPNSSG